MSDKVLVTFSEYLEQSGHQFDCNEDGPAGALALCAAAVLFVLLATITAAHDSFLGQACSLKLEEWSCHDLWGCNLQPLTDWSLLLTTPTVSCYLPYNLVCRGLCRMETAMSEVFW
jgi:hypothetical protein